jgi:hypothetical protein
MGIGVFANSAKIESVTLHQDNPAYKYESTGAIYTLNGSLIHTVFAGICDIIFEIPEDVVTVNARAFEGCYKLVYLTVPRSVDSVGERAFANCISLAEVYFCKDMILPAVITIWLGHLTVSLNIPPATIL